MVIDFVLRYCGSPGGGVGWFAIMSLNLQEILNSHRTGTPVVMGILNVTPDSFSDRGSFFSPAEAVEHAKRMLDQGADIIDIGAESTRPGSDRIPAGRQIDRLRDIFPSVCKAANNAGKHSITSIDTTLAEVAAFALDVGATIINDVSAGRDDPDLLPLAGSRGASVVLMHMLGEPRTMQTDPQYDDVVGEVKEFLAERIAAAGTAGVPQEHCIIDPGIGFGKRLEHNLVLLGGVGELRELGCPVLIGPSRKRFIGELTGEKSSADRLGGTIAASLMGLAAGATIFRVHDVGAVRDALMVAAAIRDATPRT